MNLTLKWPRYFPPAGAGGEGGSPWDPLRKPLSQQNFVMNTSLYDCTLKTTIFNITINSSQITDFPFASFQFSIFKNRFPKEIFQWNLAHVGNHEYINITAIKIGNFYSGGILWAIYIFFPAPLNANLCKLSRRRWSRFVFFFLFCIKRSVSIKVTITNNTGKIEKYIDMTHCGMELEWHPLALEPFLLRYTFYQKS